MIKNYFKIAWRNLRRNKAYTAINVTGLALGIACSLLIFTLLTYELSFDNFHSNRERIYRVVTEFHEENVEYTPGVPQPLAKAFATDYTFAQKIARVKSNNKVLITLPQEKEIKKFNEEQNVAFADAEFFDIFNFPLIEGNKKTILSEPNTAIITQHIANKYFGTADAIGKIIRLDNKSDFRITGILKDLPANTDRREEIYLSYENLKDEDSAMAKDDSWGRVSSSMQCFVKLKPHITSNDVNNAFTQFEKKHLSPEDAKITVFKLQPLNDIHFNTTFDGNANKKYLWAFALVGIFLIITACVNFINLATAQALDRAKEVGVRKVMGSMPKQLFWQFITETALITLFAILLAYGFALLSAPYLNMIFKTKMQILPFSNLSLIVFLAIVAVVVIFLSGSYPALVLASFQPILALKGKLSQKNIGVFSLRRILVIIQFAISQVLIIGTLVISSQMHFSKNTDLGFSKEGIVLLPIPTADKTKMNTLRTRVSVIAGVNSLSLCQQPPASQSNHSTDIRFDNRAKGETWEINEKNGDDQYLKTFGLKLVAGRNLFPSDTVREFLVNETVVKKLGILSAKDIIGKSLEAGGQSGQIVGVIKNFYNSSFRREISPICVASNTSNYHNCAVKLDMHNLKPALRSFKTIWEQTYPDQLYSYQFLDERIAKFYEEDDIMLRLVEVFSCIAILIGCLGLYGLISFMAIRKTKEIGIRKILGASIKSIIWIFGKEFSTLLVIAFLIAAPLGWWAMNDYLQDFKYRVHIGPGIFLVAIALTFIIASFSVTYRSVKAALTNPVNSLKSE